MTASPPPAPRRPWTALLTAAGLLACLGGLAELYGTSGFGRKVSSECRGTAAALARLGPLVGGEVAALKLERSGRLVPNLSFSDADGQPRTLQEFRGRTVLLNLWATWCVPCRKEMPALDRLQAKLGGADFQVVALNIDTARLDRPRSFLKEANVTHLALYTDSAAAALQALRSEVLGLPTTLLVDPQGCELGNMAGPAAWDSPEATTLIEAAKRS